MSRTVSRALDLLEVVLVAPQPLGLMELVETTDIDKSTAQRLLGFLVERGSLVRDPGTKRYSVGPRSLALAASVGSRSDLRLVAAPHLDRLRDLSNETVSLHILVGDRRVCVDGRESDSPVRRVIPLGESIPVQFGPSGKVILAHLPEAEIAAIAAELTADAAGALRTELAEARRLGYLHTESDRTTGIRAVSAPIFDVRAVSGSITIAGPSERWRREDAEATATHIVEAAQAISASLGAQS